MAYDPQQQRPEQQVANKSRQSLNIQQPGEPSDFDRQFFSAESWNKPVVEPEATMGDYVKAAGAGALDMVAGVGQLFKAGNQILDEKNADTAGSAASPLGLDGQMMDVMRQNAGNPLSRAGSFIIEGAGDLAGAASQRIKDSYSDGAKAAASLDFVNFEHNQAGDITGVSAGEGLFDKDAWFINAIPTVAQLLTAGGMSKLGAGAAREMAERATFNRLSKTMPEEAARQIAKETADRAAAVAGKTTFVGAMTGTAQGQGGLDMRAQVNGLSFNELMGSSTFQSAFSAIDANPSNANLSDTQKLELARAQVADQAASAVTADPRLLALNIAASTLGDHTLLSLLTKKAAANGILSGAAKGALFEGVTEFAQGSGQRYVQNEQLIGTAGQNIDPMKDVLEVGANNAVLGAGLGSSIGAVGGMRGRNSHSASEPSQNPDTNPTAEPPAPAQPQRSPYEEATQRYAAMDRAAVLREYANADLSNNADAKRAANERLAGIDREESVNQFAEKYQQQSDDELLVAYRGLNENTKRSDEEQIQYEAARSVLSQRLGANQPQATQVDVPEWQSSEQQPSSDGNGSSIPVVKMGDDSAPPGYTGEWRDGEPVISVTQGADNPQFNPENVAGTPQSRIDEFRDTPAYLRQDPRIQGFAEDSDVQQALAEQQDSPTAEQLIRQQIEQGDQGYSPQELEALEQAERIIAARRPRLPAPGQTSVIAMPGEVRQPVGDDSQAGTGPQFDAGQQVRGQEFIPAERSQAMNEVGRANQTYDGEAVPSNVIEDKNIIFSGSPTIDEGQTAQPPQFTEGETRTQRQTRQFSDAMGVNDQAALPDQRQRVGNVPIDAQTEAYARGEPVGELKFYQRDRPFSNEHVAKHSKWGKMPRATVEKVDGGYAVRLPPERTKDTITLPSGEVLTVTMDRDVPGSAILTTEDGRRIGLNATQVDGIKNELAGDSPVGGGIGDLARLNAALGRIRTHTEHDFAAHLIAERDTLPANQESKPYYSRQVNRPDGLTVPETQRIADDFVREYNGNIPVDIRVYARQEDAYGPRATQENEGRIPGAYHAAGKGRIVLNAASIRNAADGRTTLRHEVLGHYGLNTFKSADKRLVIDAIIKTRKDPKYRSLWEQIDKHYSDKSEPFQAEEVFAHAAELERTERNARSRQRIIPASVLHAFQMALRQSGLVKGPMRISELYDAVDAVADGIRSGRRKQQTFPKTDQDQFRRDGDTSQNASKSGGVSVSGADIGGGNIIHDGSFSRDGSKPETGMLRDRVQLAADGFVSHLNGAAKIKVKAVQTQAEAAAMMPNGIPAEFGTVHAIYQPELSRVIVIADNIANARELRAKLRHEVIAHHGLASVIGDVEYDRIMRVLHQTRDSQNKTIQDVWQQVEQSYGQESLETQANEFLAHMAERSELTKLGGVWDRFVTLMTNALRKAGVLNPMDITPAEIRNILRTITGRFQKTAMYANEQPGTREFDNTFSRTDALYSQSNDSVDPLKPLPQEAEQYRADLDRAMRSLKSGDVSVKLGRTPPVLRALGAPNLDMFINRDTVRKATNGVKHDVPLSVIENLPELMHDPLAVYRSSTQTDAVVILLEAQDTNGNPVVSAVHMNAKRDRLEVNRVASVYGTIGGMAKIQGMENAGLALYRRKKQNPEWLHSKGLQLPKENTVQGSEPMSGTAQELQLLKRGSPDQGSGQNILSSADIRKNKTLYSRSANPAMDAETSRKMGFNVEKGWFDKAKDFYQMASDSDRADLKQWWQETFRKLNTKTFDGLAPLKYAEDAAGKSDAMVSGYTAARMAAGSGSVTAAVLEHGLVRYNKNEGITERIPGTGKADSLMGILDGLGNHRENFLKWIAGHRSERLMAEGKENNFTADEIAYMKSLNRGNEKLFADQKVKYDAFIKSIIDLQQDMGLIDPQSRATWEDAWYLPYYREAENGEIHGPWTTRGIANQSSTIRKLKGSDLTIKDPIENLFNYVAKSVDASMKNEAMRRSIVNLGDTGVIDIIENPNQIDYQRLNLKKDTVKVFVDGKEQLARINDPHLYRAFTMIDLERSKSLFMRAARQAKRVLTIGTTSMPDFIIRNFIRDSVHSWAINKDGFKAIRSSWDGLNKAMRTDNTLVDMMFAGATFGGGYSNVYDPGGTASNIRKVLRRKGYKDSQIREFESSIVRNSKEAMDKMGVALEKYRKVSEGAENANRVATYDAALKAGKSKAQAAFESRDLMDFSMQGSSSLVIGLSDMVPFFNARLQGMSKLGRAIKDDPREVLKRGGYIAGLSLALLALNWGDERYEELQDWDKDAYWHAWFGDQHIRIPKPFEIGLMFGTLPERFARALGGEDTPGKFGKVMAHNFFETMAFNPIPQVTRPIIETFVNYDFFKGGPIEGMADKNVIAGARFNDQTSLLMREIGESANLSPKMLDHIITGYTGTLGSYILGATNIIMRNLGDNGESASLRVDELPVIKAIFRGSDPAKSTQFTEDFYQMMTKVNQINSTINDYRKQGRHDDANELLQDNREKLSQRKAFTATQKQVKQLNDQIELTRIDRILTADQKRERIDRLMEKRNMLVQQTVKRVHPYFD
ncbi:LPD38 domain-containing protein [Pectobacterium polonicum]|uniref:LPD38 domain-containing protein n=1 Tax=Pectobacterium polonicum TaxID=2485124 RepID=UPI002B252EC5|nr:LPD38 domain-containing protein [Pectobacterium polonicum]